MNRLLKEIQPHLSDGNGLYWTRAFRGTRSSMRTLHFAVETQQVAPEPTLQVELVDPPAPKRPRLASEEEFKLQRLTEYLGLPQTTDNQPDAAPEIANTTTVVEEGDELPIDAAAQQQHEQRDSSRIFNLDERAASVHSIQPNIGIDCTPAWETVTVPACATSIANRDLLDPCPCGALADMLAVESLTSFGAVIRQPSNITEVAIPVLSQHMDEGLGDDIHVIPLLDIEVQAVMLAGSQSTESEPFVELAWDHEFTLECEGAPTHVAESAVVLCSIEQLFPEASPPLAAAGTVAPPVEAPEKAAEDCTICLLPLNDIPEGQLISKRATTALILHLGDNQGSENKTCLRMPCCNCAVHAACLERCVQLRNVRKVCCGCFQTLTDQHITALEDFFEDTLKVAEGFRSQIIGGISTLGMFSVVSRPARVRRQ